jgi:hypothetical protein
MGMKPECMDLLPSGMSCITSGLTDKAEKEVMFGNHCLIDGLSHEAIKILNVGITHCCLFLSLAASAVGSTGRHASLASLGICGAGITMAGYLMVSAGGKMDKP